MVATRVCFVTLGTRGDVQPFLVLARYLITLNNKWDPVIVTAQNYREWITSNGVDFAPLSIKKETNVDDDICRPELAEAVAIGDARKFLELIQESREDEIDSMDAIEQACQGAQLIITNQLTINKAAFVGEKLNIPVGLWFSYPNHKTSAFPSALLPLPSCWIWNRFTYTLLDFLMWPGMKDNIAAHRERLGLSAIKNSSEYRRWLESYPAYYAFSPKVLPKPKDYPEHAIFGSYILDKVESNGNDLDPQLLEFIDKSSDKRPVIYLGFGSMPVTMSASFQIFIDQLHLELEKSNFPYRFILFTGKSTPTAKPVALNIHKEYMLTVSHVSHASLFPKCDFIIHHGGSGTTAAALASGVPSMAIPVFGDQPFWAERVRQIMGKNAPRKISYQKLSAKAFLDAVKQGLACKDPARDFADDLSSENGLESAYKWLNSLVLNPSQ